METIKNYTDARIKEIKLKAELKALNDQKRTDTVLAILAGIILVGSYFLLTF